MIPGFRVGVQIKKLLKIMVWKGFLGTYNEFLIDTTFALTYPVNLAY